jgi:hypothetical protein
MLTLPFLSSAQLSVRGGAIGNSGAVLARANQPPSNCDMKIDINKLTEAELIDLNNRIVERLRLLHQMRSHVDMLEFRIGERVEFQPDGHPLVVGILTKYNKKTVTVLADSGQRWNVAPRFLRRAPEVQVHPTSDPNVIRSPKR